MFNQYELGMPSTFDFSLKEQLSTGQLLFPHLPVCAYAKKNPNHNQPKKNPTQTTKNSKKGEDGTNTQIFSKEAPWLRLNVYFP